MRLLLERQWLAYRALFTWLNPLGYVSSRVIAPLALALLFAAAIGGGTASGRAQAVVGASLLAAWSAVLVGVCLAVGNERLYGTLTLWMASPERLLTGLSVRAGGHVIDGVVGGLITYLIIGSAYGVPISLRSASWMTALLAVASLAGFASSLPAAAIALRFRDPFSAPTLLQAVVVVAGGLFVPAQVLGLQSLSQFLPLHHVGGAAAALNQGERPPLEAVVLEFGVMCAWGLVGLAVLYGGLVAARRRAVLDRM